MTPSSPPRPESDAHLSPAVPVERPAAYPAELEMDITLPDGEVVSLRPIVPADIERMRHAFEVADSESIRRRFLTGAPPSDDTHLHYLVEVDYRRRLALLALDNRGDSVGIARYEGAKGSASAEVAIVVSPSWRRRGIGRVLFAALEQPAQDNGIEQFVAGFSPDNRAIDGLLSDLGYADRWLEDGLAWVVKTF